MKNNFVFAALIIGRMLGFTGMITVDNFGLLCFIARLDFSESRVYLLYISRVIVFFFCYVGATLDLVELLILIRITALEEMPVISIGISLDLITFTSIRLAWYLFDK